MKGVINMKPKNYVLKIVDKDCPYNFTEITVKAKDNRVKIDIDGHFAEMDMKQTNTLIDLLKEAKKDAIHQ